MRKYAGPRVLAIVLILLGGVAFAVSLPRLVSWLSGKPAVLAYQPRQEFEPTGFNLLLPEIVKWTPESSLAEIAACWHRPGHKMAARLDVEIARKDAPPEKTVELMLRKSSVLNFEGAIAESIAVLEEVRPIVEQYPRIAEKWLYTVIYLQAITSLRSGETENCVMCRGASSCILPISKDAIHADETGSRKAIKHFTEYLDKFPDDLEVKWLLNVAHMTLGEHPHGVDPRFLISLNRYNTPEFGIGRFRDIAALAGIERLNQGGGTILEDFDNDGLLDLVFTSFDSGQPMAFYRNKGNGAFEERTNQAGLAGQLGGLNCVQADFNNDGLMDIFIPRGAWLKQPMRPSLLRNNGNCEFTDVTQEAGMLHAMNTDTAQWADFDNDGWLDLFVCGEAQPSRLYRNNANGTFDDVAAQAGLGEIPGMWKGCTWFDYDNDRFPDLFLNSFDSEPQLFHNNRDGTFSDTSAQMGIVGPQKGLSCWSWDYDNDGWVDLFATCYDRTLGDAVKGLIGERRARRQSKLYRNIGGERFQDVTQEAGLDQCFETMGSNFADFDNDGFLDFYLGTGDHDIATLVPNRMFRNLGGQRFVDITSSSGTGHLQKGHGVGCGDWNRDGSVDIAIEMGGAIPGDKYHNVLFLNPGQGNNWLNVKLVGKKTNAAAIGARIKVVTDGESPLTVYRYVCSGSSFGANPLEKMVGLAKAGSIAELEIFWPTSGTTQTFRNVSVNQAIEVTEFETDYRKRGYEPLPMPQ